MHAEAHDAPAVALEEVGRIRGREGEVSPTVRLAGVVPCLWSIGSVQLELDSAGKFITVSQR